MSGKSLRAGSELKGAYLGNLTPAHGHAPTTVHLGLNELGSTSSDKLC